jgi:xylulokinase
LIKDLNTQSLTDKRKEGLVTASIGTSGTVVAPTKQPKRDPGGRLHTFNHAVPKMW